MLFILAVIMSIPNLAHSQARLGIKPRPLAGEVWVTLARQTPCLAVVGAGAHNAGRTVIIPQNVPEVAVVNVAVDADHFAVVGVGVVHVSHLSGHNV
jgi:hypothetical protein